MKSNTLLILAAVAAAFYFLSGRRSAGGTTVNVQGATTGSASPPSTWQFAAPRAAQGVGYDRNVSGASTAVDVTRAIGAVGSTVLDAWRRIFGGGPNSSAPAGPYTGDPFYRVNDNPNVDYHTTDTSYSNDVFDNPIGANRTATQNDPEYDLQVFDNYNDSESYAGSF